MSRRRLRITAMVAIGLGIVLFFAAAQALQWVALILVLASIAILMWTLMHPAERDAR